MIGSRAGSIVTRLVTLHVLAIAVASILLPLAMYVVFQLAVEDLQRGALVDQANEIEAALRRNAGGRLELVLPPSLAARYSRGYGRYAFAVVDNGGRILLASDDQTTPIGTGDALGLLPHHFRFERGAAGIIALSRPVTVAGQRVWIQVSQDVLHRDALIDDIVAGFLRHVGWIVVPALALLLAVDLLIFRRALRPLMQASDMAARIGPASADIRLPSVGLPRELAPLIAAVNEALDRLEQGFRVQREFTADAAHELRTPLAVLKTRVDLMEDKTVAAMLRQDIDTMGRLVEQMLDIAEADSLVVAATERADLRAVCADVAAFLAPLALRSGRDIAVTGADRPVWVRGNNEALFHAVANLAENALRHTPKDSTVELDVDADGVVRVLDEGPGVPEAERSLVFRRFWRRDRRGNGSTGLGLAIVSRIVEAHGGRVAVGDRPSRGAAFVLDLSAARLPAAA